MHIRHHNLLHAGSWEPEISLSSSFLLRLPEVRAWLLSFEGCIGVHHSINKYLLAHLLFATPYLLGGDIQGHKLWLLSSQRFLGR